ncbi:beta strand repeat-containing protein [Flavobacterium sp. RSB2_4_14]|uniref:beta strand repeat-containing protein n=1 Tax=Flavobacterium sp. RSB2_4_14 TaxID=3447665 RepID=UPI003F2D407F
MKNSIKGTMCKFGLILFLMMFSISGKAQTRYTMSITATAPTDRTMDVTFSLTCNSAGGERFAGYQAGINFNTAIINGGTISAAYVAGSKSSPALDAMVIPTPGVATAGHMRISLQALSGANGVDMAQGTTLILGTYRITNSVAWATSSNATLWLQNVLATGKTNSLVNGYPFGAATPAVSITTTAPVAGALALGYTQASPLSLPLNVPTETCFTSGSAGTISGIACFGQTTSATITMSPAASNNAITYTVDGGASTPGTLVANAFTVSGLAAGLHSVVVTGNGGCTTPVTVNFTVDGPTSALSLSLAHTNTLCAIGATGTITATANGGTAPYTYSLDGGASQTSALFTDVAAGLHSVTVTDANSCVTTSTVTVGSPAVLSATASATATTTPSSNDGTATAIPAGGTGPYLISWDTTPVQNGATATGLSAGTYTATIVDQNGCTTTASASVTAPACAIAISATHVDVSCFGGTNGSISASSTGGVGTVTYTITPGGSSNTTGSFIGLASGTYSISAVDASSCSTSTSVTVGTPTAVVASSTAGTILCNGGTTTVVVSATGGNNPSSGTGTFIVSAGPYSFTVTDDNGCTSTTSGTVSQPAVLVASSVAGSIACFGGTTTVNVSATGGTAPYSGAGTFTVSAGVYSYTVTDANGCTSTTSGTVTQPGQLTSTDNQVSCGSYTWSISGLTYDVSGVYTFNTVNGSGCTIINTLNLTVLTSSTPTVGITSSDLDNSFAYGTPITFTATAGNLSGGIANYNFKVNGISVQSGASATYVVNNLVDNDQVSVDITVTGGLCLSTNTASSNIITNDVFGTPYFTSITNYCGQTLPFINSGIGCSVPSGVVGTLGYRFKVKNNVTGVTAPTVDRSVPNFNLTMTSVYTYSTSFDVQVAAIVNGVEQPYSAVCVITTPAPPSNAVGPCTQTLSLINDRIFATTVFGSQLYRWRVALSTAPGTTYIYTTPFPSFRLGSVTGGLPLTYGKTYTVEVQSDLVINGVATTTPYSSLCNVTTPAVSTISVSINGCNQTLETINQRLYINSVLGASSYVYRVSLVPNPVVGQYNDIASTLH